MEVIRGEEFLVKRNLPGQRVGAKAWFDFFTEYLTDELNYKFSPLCPRLGRNEKSIILSHEGDLIFTGLKVHQRSLSSTDSRQCEQD